MSEEVKEVKEVKEVNPEKQAKRDARKKAMANLFALANELKNEKMHNALKVLRPSLYGISTGGGGSSLGKKFIGMLTAKNQVAEDVLFAEFKVGRKDCAGFIRKHLRSVEPANRVWITFDPNTGIYKIAGKGEKEPQGWKGYLPVKENVDLR